MTADDSLLARCLDDLARQGGEPDPELVGPWIPALLADPDVARSLVVHLVTSTADDTDPPALEQELLSHLLDEARRAGEDGRDAGPEFLQAAEATLATTQRERMTTDGMFMLARLYARAGVAVPEALQVPRPGYEAEETGHDDADPEHLLPDLEQGLRQLVDDCDGDLLTAHGAMVETLAGIPEEPRLALIHHVAAQEDSDWQQLAAYWLLDREPAVREVVSRAYRDHARGGTLDARIAACLPLLRSWLPRDGACQQVDEALAIVRRRSPGGPPFPDAAGIDEVHASLPDGAGAQYLGIATGAGRNRRWAMILTKTGYGIRDAYLLPALDAGDERAMLDGMLGGMDAVPVETQTLHLLLAAAMAEGLAREEPPAPGLLNVAAACGLVDLRPQPLTVPDWLGRLDPAGELADLTPQKRGRLINRSADWADSFTMLDSWFEETSECDRVLEFAPHPAGRRRALREHLQARRDWWAGQCLRSALVLRDTAEPDLWRSFAATAAALLEGRELKRIPVMEQILETTIDAWESRRHGPPEPPNLEFFDDAADAGVFGDADSASFSERHRRTLQAFYDTGPGARVWDAGYFGLHGYLFALVTHPDLIAPSEWLPALMGEESSGDAARSEPAFEEIGQFNEVLGALMSLYNAINEDVLEERVGLPADCTLRSRPQDNFWPEAPVGQWSRGFRMARARFDHQVDLLQEEFGDEEETTFNCGIATLMLELFGDRERAQALVRDNPEPDAPTLEQLAAMAHEDFEDQLRLLAALARLLRQHDAEQEPLPEASPPASGPAPVRPVRVEKTGRNEPCPCGSGKKYKRCCGDRRRA